jgi:NADH:ubiquinone oxidoreductase subunit 5 (subunit L)/multisubunit Na+/H+ antiporter MnhA subunit
MSPPGGNDSAWCIDELESRKFGVAGLIVTMEAMAGGSVLSSFLLVNLIYTGDVADEAENCNITLEIMIIVINFNNADLLYYLLFDAFAQRRRVWCTMVPVERQRPPSVSLLVPSCLIFPQSVCVFVGCAFHVYLKGLKAFFGMGRRVLNSIKCSYLLCL